jgi:hypothetical protein
MLALPILLRRPGPGLARDRRCRARRCGWPLVAVRKLIDVPLEDAPAVKTFPILFAGAAFAVVVVRFIALQTAPRERRATAVVVAVAVAVAWAWADTVAITVSVTFAVSVTLTITISLPIPVSLAITFAVTFAVTITLTIAIAIPVVAIVPTITVPVTIPLTVTIAVTVAIPIPIPIPISVMVTVSVAFPIPIPFAYWGRGSAIAIRQQNVCRGAGLAVIPLPLRHRMTPLGLIRVTLRATAAPEGRRAAAPDGTGTAAMRSLTSVTISICGSGAVAVTVATIAAAASLAFFFGLFLLVAEATDVLFKGAAAGLIRTDGLEGGDVGQAAADLLVCVVDGDRGIHPLHMRAELLEGATRLAVGMSVIVRTLRPLLNLEREVWDWMLTRFARLIDRNLPAQK